MSTTRVPRPGEVWKLGLLDRTMVTEVIVNSKYGPGPFWLVEYSEEGFELPVLAELSFIQDTYTPPSPLTEHVVLLGYEYGDEVHWTSHFGPAALGVDRITLHPDGTWERTA